jgi:hypothetical protein
MTTATAVSIDMMAKDLVEKCRKGDYKAAIQAYYDKNVVCTESMAMPDCPKQINGLDAVLRKSDEWDANTEVHRMEISDPLVSESCFAVRFIMDATCKQSNQRMTVNELAVYHVKNNKITQVDFLYPTPEGC